MVKTWAIVIGFTLFSACPTSLHALPYRASLNGNTLEQISPQTIPRESHNIIKNVIENTVDVTPELQMTFWDSLSHYGPFNEQKRRYIKDKLLGKSLTLKSYLYRDMLISLYVQDVFKSDVREAYENRLLEIGAIDQNVVNENEARIKQFIAMDNELVPKDGEPRKTHTGVQKLITETSAIEKRINTLFILEEKLPPRNTTPPESSQIRSSREVTTADYQIPPGFETEQDPNDPTGLPPLESSFPMIPRR